MQGIWIRFDPKIKQLRDWPISEHRMDMEYNVEFWVGSADSPPAGASKFINNTEIRDSLARMTPIKGRLGYCEIARVGSKAIQWGQFQPFHAIRQHPHPFKRRGIAQLLELEILLHLHQQFPEIKTIKHHAIFGVPLGISDERVGQIDKRGLGFNYSIARAIQMLRWKIAHDTLYHRGKRLLSTPAGEKIMARVKARDPLRWQNRLRSLVKRLKPHTHQKRKK